MSRLRSLAVLVLLVASSLLTLKLMGLSQWIQAILVIAVELSLGVVLHEIIEASARRDRDKRRQRGVRQMPSGLRRKLPPNALKRRESSDAPAPEMGYTPRSQLLLPLHSHEPTLIDFAIREARVHRATLNLLFLRKCAVLPMGPLGPPGIDEDHDALQVVEATREAAKSEGVPVRVTYEATANPVDSILEFADVFNVDFVVMSAPRHGGWISKLLARDELRNVLRSLPDHVSLLVHT